MFALSRSLQEFFADLDVSDSQIANGAVCAYRALQELRSVGMHAQVALDEYRSLIGCVRRKVPIAESRMVDSSVVTGFPNVSWRRVRSAWRNLSDSSVADVLL